MIETYDDRDKILSQLGFRSYEKYLKSSLWRAIKKRQLKRIPNCEVCGELAVVVHHRSYCEDVLRGDEIQCKKFLASLCTGCHHGIEFDDMGNKLSIVDVEHRLCRCIGTQTVPSPPPRKKLHKPIDSKGRSAYFKKLKRKKFYEYEPEKKRNKPKNAKVGAMYSRWCNRCDQKVMSPYVKSSGHCPHCGLDGSWALRMGKTFKPGRDHRPSGWQNFQKKP